MHVSRSLALPAIAAISAFVILTGDATAAPLPERVTFASADGRTTLVGYVFLPEKSAPGYGVLYDYRYTKTLY